MPTKGGITTVKDIVMNFLENKNIDLDATDMYILGLYDDLVAISKHTYEDLLYIKDKYYADILEYEGNE